MVELDGPRGVSVSETARSALMKASLSSVLPPVFSSAASTHHAVEIETGRVAARDVAVVAYCMSATKRLLLGVSRSAVYQAADDHAERLVAEALQQRVVDRPSTPPSTGSCLEAEVGVLLA